MQGTILIFGSDEMLLVTRSRILEHAGYRVLTAPSFPNALIALMNNQIDVLVLCQSLNDEERRSILESAHARQPNIKCAALTYAGADHGADGVDFCQRLDGPRGLLSAIGRMVTKQESTHTGTVN